MSAENTEGVRNWVGAFAFVISAIAFVRELQKINYPNF
ncbi:Pleckstriny domain [Nostoc flagelliforme CCNUN1]|uniref:Pleckstriny domain n=1 Tax=Nostoc flagelliforme CCNUN1 TaxID=2038116 RepID=A0A2K8SP45_9NOSO|nr:Pleckstriny domain [Nostoc flagelliforme CCNUN1]